MNEMANTAVWNELAELYMDILTATYMIAMISELCIQLIDYRAFD